jgi:sugar O-acyltransferase (sialic acid O-acetyltransferase NeuD family)
MNIDWRKYMSKKVVVFGMSVLTEMICRDVVEHDDFEIAAITVDRAYMKTDNYKGFPVIAFEDIVNKYPPEKFDMLVVYTSQENMRLKEKIYNRVKDKGYSLRNYISPKADCHSDLEMGVNNIIMAHAYLGFHGKMGDNNFIRQKVYLGHDFVMGSHNTIAPGCRIGGHCIFESHIYIGLGAVVNNMLKISKDTLVGSGAVVIRNTEECSVNVGNPSRVIRYFER